MRPRRDDDGMTLVELMMSIVIFTLAATAIASGFIAAIKTSGNDRNRLAATNLAQRELEIVRNQFTESGTGYADLRANGGYALNANPLPGQTAGQPYVVDGRPYVVKRNVEPIDGAAGKSMCDGGTSVLYPALAVNVQVTWPGLGTGKPIESNTILTPPKDQIDSTSSWVAVKLTGSTNNRVKDVVVKLTKVSSGVAQTDTTADDGCAAFQVTDFSNSPNNYSVSVNQTGYVDNNGVQSLSKTISVTQSTFQLVSLSYDKEAQIAVTFKSSDSSYAVPTGVTGVGLASTVFTLGEKVYTGLLNPTGSNVSDLWPTASGYSLWAGGCTQNDPVNTGGSREPAIGIVAGDTEAGTAWLRPISATVKKSGVAQPGLAVVAVPVDSSGCATSEQSLALGTTDASGSIKSSLPGGNYTISVTGKTASGSWPQTGNLDPSPTSAPVVVNVTIA